METDQNNNPQIDSLDFSIAQQRRDLLPNWIKAFCWIFMSMGVVVVIGLLAALSGLTFTVAFYGLKTTEPFSLIGLAISTIFIVKGMAAYGLWMGRNWAIPFAEFDAVAGISICGCIMFVFPFLSSTPGFTLNIRLELLLLIPFWKKIRQLEYDWDMIGEKQG